MRRVLLGLALLAVVCGWPAASYADEVVEFTDGRYLQVRSHADEGYYVRLVVGRDSLIIIPANRIDAIRRDQQVVYRCERDEVSTPPLSAVNDRSESAARVQVERLGPGPGREAIAPRPS